MTFLFIAAAACLIYLLIKYVKLKKEYKKIKDPQEKIKELEAQIIEMSNLKVQLNSQCDDLYARYAKEKEQEEAQNKKLRKIKELYQAVAYSIENSKLLTEEQVSLYDDLCPTVMLNLHAMEIKELQKEFRANDKLIQDTVVQYENRYTTKNIASIYKLMTIAMRAELQNILYALKYEKLDTAVDSVRKLSAKYYTIAADGNQTIAGTLREYIGKIEYLFINSVKVEYNYYVKKEQAKAEQAALREQMRMEAAEKKALEEERKKVEKEESKYQAEILKLTDTISSASDDEKAKLEERIAELQNQLASVAEKKEEIIHLQNGKAGTVYVISNLGSFGEDVFKIGMTRRAEPQERIDELGDASVPFQFDVHSFIFSEDAVALEKKLHTILNQKRINKVNLRKEFFRISMDELQKLVYEIEPTASFNTTMAAEEFRQSMSTDEVYTSDYTTEDTE